MNDKYNLIIIGLLLLILIYICELKVYNRDGFYSDKQKDFLSNLKKLIVL